MRVDFKFTQESFEGTATIKGPDKRYNLQQGPDKRTLSKKSASQVNLHLSTTVSACPHAFQQIRTQFSSTHHSDPSFTPLSLA